MLKLAADNELNELIRNEGFNFVKDFTWNKLVVRYHKLLNYILKRND